MTYRVVSNRVYRRRGDEVLPRTCAQLSRRRETRTIGRSVSWCGQYPRLTLIDPPMVQLMPTKVLLTLLLSFHVFLTRKHAMFQVRGVVAMATKHRDGRGKRPRSEVNACP